MIIENIDGSSDFVDIIKHEVQYTLASRKKIIDPNYHHFEHESIAIGKVSLLNVVEDLRETARKLLANIRNITFCVSEADIDLIEQIIPKINSSMQWNYKKKFFYSYNEFSTFLRSFFVVFEYALDVAFKSDQVMTAMRLKYANKVSFIKDSIQKGFKYINKPNFFNTNIENSTFHTLTVSISDKFNPCDVKENVRLALHLKNTYRTLNFELLLIDNDQISHKEEKSLLVHYFEQKVLNKNVRRECISSGDNLVMSEGTAMTHIKCNERAVLKLSCPYCDGPPLHWKCRNCCILLEYCSNGIIVCNCGGFAGGNLKYCCSNYFHSEFHCYDNIEMMHQQLSQIPFKKNFNILLVGQTGVGKSTFINALVNSLKFSKFEDALKGDVVEVMPTQFTIYDVDGTPYHSKSLKQDVAEDLTIGASATQTTCSYTVYNNNKRITIIDTPGLGDTRGYEQDKKNIHDLISHLQHIPEVHAICFLLLPDESRMTKPLSFVVQEVLCNFPKKITNNLLFVFTKARSTNYRPGATFMILEKIVETFRGQYQLSDNVVYTFDNESFRFLYALKTTKITFDEKERALYSKSWERSTEEYGRLLSYIFNLKPISTENILQVHQARITLFQLTEEIIKAGKKETEESLLKTLQELQEKKKTLTANLSSTEEVIVQTKTKPRIACMGCIGPITNKTIYKQICQENYDSYEKINVINNAELLNAPILNGGKCSVCSCLWGCHLLIDYSQRLENKVITNAHVNNKIKKIDLDIGTINNILKCSSDPAAVEIRKKRRETVLEYIAGKAILICNEIGEDYLAYCIEGESVEENKSDDDYDRIIRLKRWREIEKNIRESFSPLRTIIVTTELCEDDLLDNVFDKDQMFKHKVLQL